MSQPTAFPGGTATSPLRALFVAVLISDLVSAAQYLPTTNDVWDLRQGVTITANSLLNGGFDARDIFGGAYSATEPSDTVFSDGQPAGFVHFIEWQTPAPVAIGSFVVFAVGDGPAYLNEREFAQFVLKAKSAGAADFDLTLFSFTPTHPYDFVDPANQALIAAEIAPVVAQYFRAEFVQYASSRGFDGPRVLELDAFPPDCGNAPPGLVGWWRAEGNADGSLGNHPGGASNGVAYAAGKVGQAFSFDGVDDYVRIGAAPGLDVGAGGGMTIEGWIQPSDPLLIQPLVEWNDGVSAIGVHLWANAEYPPGAIRGLYANLVDTQGGIHVVGTGPGVLKSNAWQHVAVTYDKASGIGVLYLDGTAVLTEALGNFTPQTSYPLWFGTRPAGAGYWFGPYHGLMDEISLYDRALSAAEIQAIYGAGEFGKCPEICTPSPAGLVGWWPGNGSALDVAGANAGTNLNETSFEAAKVAAGFRFDGTNDCVLVPYSPGLDLTNFTVEAWVKPLSQVSDPDNQELIFGQAFGKPQLVVRPGTNGLKVVLMFLENLASFPEVVSTNEIPVNAFSHVAGTWDGTNLSVYINAALDASFAPGKAPGASACPFYIGGFQNACGYTGQFFNGIVDEPSLYNRALTASEIHALFAAGSAGKCPPAAAAITAGPASQSVNSGEDAVFRVFATGAPPLSYHWYFGTNTIDYATNEVLTLTNVQAEAEGDYSVIVSNAFGSATSPVARLTILFPPVITIQPISQTVLIGASASFSVAAQGTEPLSYQWRRNGLTVSGATASILVIGSAQTGNAGTYTVRVSNSAGSALSDPAVLKLASGRLSVRITPEGPRLDVAGQNGANYAIEYSPDTKQWTTLGTFLSMPDTWFFTDPSAGSASQRFYRLRKMP
jgi:hypothetical protein